MKLYKKLEIMIKDFEYLNYEDMEKIKSGDFKVEIRFNNPISSYSLKDGVKIFVGYYPPTKPVEFYLILEEDE